MHLLVRRLKKESAVLKIGQGILKNDCLIPVKPTLIQKITKKKNESSNLPVKNNAVGNVPEALTKNNVKKFWTPTGQLVILRSSGTF